MSSIHLAALLSVLLIKYLNFPAAPRSISLLMTSGVPFALRNTGNGRLFRQQGHTTGRQDKWAESRDSFIIANNADICVVAYNKEVERRRWRGMQRVEARQEEAWRSLEMTSRRSSPFSSALNRTRLVMVCCWKMESQVLPAAAASRWLSHYAIFGLYVFARWTGS